MSLIYEIYNTVIDNKYVLRSPISKQSLQFNGREIIAANMKIALDNTDTSVFSPFESGSLFFGADWDNQPVTIYDTELQAYIWKGRIKNITEDWKNNTITVDTTNWVRDMADTACIYSDSGITLADHVKNILTDPDLLGLTDDDLYLGGFTNAINIQDDASVYCTVAYTQEKNKKCLTVIKELCRIGQMHLFTDKNNLVSLLQWEAWTGITGTIIRGGDLKTKTFKAWYDKKNIYNDISIYYDNAGTATQYTDGDTTSQDQYGKRVFAVPNVEPDTVSANNNILLESLTAATWAGDLALERYKDKKQKIELSLLSQYNFLALADVIALSFDPFTTEPAYIEKVEYDSNSENVKIEGEFLNIPTQYIVRDEEPPVKVELIETLPGNASIHLRWTQSFESDHIGYRIYFTTSPGEWEGEFCNLGSSPITVKNPDIDDDGYAYQKIYELNNGTEYFFKVTSFDSSYNESDDSNVLSAIPIASLENLYCLTGDVYTGLTLDNSNPKGGAQISGLSVYGTDVYGTGVYTYTANYESFEYYDPDGFDFVKFRGSGDAGDIKYQIRYSEDGAIWGSWSSEGDAIGIQTVALDDTYPYFQIRFKFYSSNWGDADKIYIQEVV